MDNRQYTDLLKKVLNDEDVTADEIIDAEARQTIIEAGDPVSNIYLLLKGSTYVIIEAASGSMIVADTLEAPQLFGLSELVADKTHYEASITSQSPCQLIRIPAETFKNLLIEDPSLYPLITRYLAELAAHNMYFMQDRSMFNHRDRLGLYLYDAASICTLPTQISESREQLALLVHLNTRTLYRYLDEFDRHGYLKIINHKITIDEDNYRRLRKDFGSLR